MIGVKDLFNFPNLKVVLHCRVEEIACNLVAAFHLPLGRPLLTMIAKQTEVRMYYVYILASKANAMLYIGVTNDLRHRLREHREGLFEGHTKTYDIHKLVFLKSFPTSTMPSPVKSV